MQTQAIIFDNSIYNIFTARNWLRKHKYKPIKNVDKTLHYLRYRLIEPDEFKNYVTRDLGNGIQLILGF